MYVFTWAFPESDSQEESWKVLNRGGESNRPTLGLQGTSPALSHMLELSILPSQRTALHLWCQAPDILLVQNKYARIPNPLPGSSSPDSFTTKILSHLLVTGLSPESLQMESQTALKGNTEALQPKAKEANFLLHYSKSVLLPGAKDMFLRKISWRWLLSSSHGAQGTFCIE